MGCGVLYQQLREIEKALGAVRRAGFDPTSDVYQQIYKVRSQIIGQYLPKMPRSLTQLVRLTGLSPGVLALWHDTETGFMVEAREHPGAPPVYHRVDEDVVDDILAGRHIHEYEALFIVPAEDIDQ